MRSIWGALLAGFCLTGGTAAGLGCSDCSVSGQDPIVYEDGTTNVSKTFYQSAAPEEEMLHFPQGRIYQFYHGFGSTPVAVDTYLSFIPQLTDTGDKNDKNKPNNVAESAGSQAVIEAWNDQYVQVRNDTCADFYLRIVITGDPDAMGGNAGATGAGGVSN